ncbi:MAG: glycosyltransferase family 2 protein [Kiritimatiellae bacterium]|nr:glycosyltransferase family 2 protein [Kiritimatiellia bacterium]
MNVAAIVLNWNRPQETAACCQALAAQSHRDLHIWVIDNGSTANTADDLRRTCPNAIVIRLDENRGFAGGVNVGIRAAQSKEHMDFYWLVNNDALCEPETLERMLEVAQRDPQIAAIGCETIEGAEGNTKRVAAGKRLRPPFYIPLEAKTADKVDYICGASLLIRSEALEDVGLLNENYFFLFEDADWAFRAKHKGWKIAVAEGDLVRHTGSATVGTLSRLQAAHYRASYIRFLRDHARCPRLAATLVTGYRLLIYALSGHWQAFAGTLDGWKRGWR